MGLTLHPGGHGHSHGGGGGHSSYNGLDSDEEKLGLTTTTRNRSDTYGSLNNADLGAGDSLATEVKGHSHRSNINVKAAFIHVIGDLLQSIGVLIAAIIIYYKPEWKLADPICTFVFSVIVLITTLNILKDILVVLMEGTPRFVNFKEISRSLKNIKEVKDIHDLRIWSLSMDKVALSVHIAISRTSDPLAILQKASSLIRSQFNITETTIQVEEYVNDMLDCTHCKDVPD